MMKKTLLQYCLIMLGSYFLSSYFFPVKELPEKYKKKLPPIEDKKKPIEDGKRDLEPQPPAGLFVRSGEVPEMPGSTKVLEKLLTQATRVKSFKIAVAVTAATLLYQQYNATLTTATYGSWKKIIEQTVYNATSTSFYDSFSSTKNLTLAERVSNFFRTKKPKFPMNEQTPFDVQLTYRHHAKILRRYIRKLLKMRVPGESIRWIIFLIGIIVGLLTSGLIPYTMGIGALVEAMSGSEGLDEAAKEVILELFYEMIEEENELVEP
jgi:hypothetical protein